MQKKQSMKKLGALLPAMSVALAVGLTLPQPANAMRNVLFPYVTTESGKFTFISILNDASSSGFGGTYHFTYGMKTAPVNPRAACSHADRDVSTTLADMMIFEVGGKVITNPGTSVLFEGGPADVPVTSTAYTYPAGSVGFLAVTQPFATDTFINGWATVVDSASGLFWTYSSDGLSIGYAGDTSDTFVALDASDGGAFQYRKMLSWYPQSIVPTSWYVLPLGTLATMGPATPAGIRRGLVTSQDHGTQGGVPGAFDLDERFTSGGRAVAIRCLGFMNRSDFLQVASDADTVNGGWASIVDTAFTLGALDGTDPGGSYATGPYLLYKIQSTTALGTIRTSVNREPRHTEPVE